MASDWLRVRHDILEDPALVRVAQALKVTEDEALGRLFRLWRYADRHSTDGVLQVSAEWMDRHVGVTLFCHALVTVGWLRERDGCLDVPHFERYMGRSAKTRALAAERQRRLRGVKNEGCHAETSRSERDKSVTREEKRREEKKNTTPTPPSSGRSVVPLKGSKLIESARGWEMPVDLGEDFRASWGAWLEHQKGQRRPPTESQLKAHLSKLGKQGSPEAARRAVEWCIENGAAGFSERVLEISREKAGQVNGTPEPALQAQMDEFWRKQELRWAREARGDKP